MKLPLPGPWQPAVLAARDDLAGRLGLPPHGVAVTRVEDAAAPTPREDAPGPPEPALEVWLLAAGETFRYRVGLGSEAPFPVLVSGATWMLPER